MIPSSPPQSLLIRLTRLVTLPELTNALLYLSIRSLAHTYLSITDGRRIRTQHGPYAFLLLQPRAAVGASATRSLLSTSSILWSHKLLPRIDQANVTSILARATATISRSESSYNLLEWNVPTINAHSAGVSTARLPQTNCPHRPPIFLAIPIEH